MEKAKRSPFIKIASIMLGASLLMTCVISGTMAKYTSTAAGTATATVAKWSIEVNDTQIAVSPAATVDFNLFETVKDTNGTDNETDVATGKIAPGTSGKFDLKVENTSEVTATYAIDFTVTNEKNIPLEFSTNGTDWKTSIDDLDIAATNIAMNAEATKTIQWRWVFNGNDTSDTTLGIEAQGTAPSVTVSATITAEQVD